jgi:tryptophan-rich sensory protein
MKLKHAFQLIAAILICEAAGIVGSLFTFSQIPTWYAGLSKPALNPPSWVFGPVWTTLYFLMGIAVFLIWQKGPRRRKVRAALLIFAAQLTLNTLWSIVFFGLHSPGWALVNIAAMWVTIVWTMIAFAHLSRPAMYLLVPYLAWVSFATYLNAGIWWLN